MIRRDRRPDESNNFWVSYADLMGGAALCFILLIGAHRFQINSPCVKIPIKKRPELEQNSGKNSPGKGE